MTLIEMDKQEVVTDGVVLVNIDDYTFTYKGVTKHMPKKVIQVMHYMILNKGKVITREELLKEVWGDDVIVDKRTVDVHITKIRSITSIECISTVIKRGYKWN